MKTYYHDPTGYPAIVLSDWSWSADSLSLPQPLWYIGSVETQVRGAGYGRAAMQACLVDADREAVTLILTSAPDEEWTHEWYLRLGFSLLTEDRMAMVRHPARRSGT